ncbi:DUF881 domain-containing protein [Candidatus Peregrinibacteria bacterium]|nr:DUF881 domain-containing protein [Candidatus Peregrinibacteria bacterium]
MKFSEPSFRTQLVFVASGVFIGLLITSQFRSSVPTSSYPSDELAIKKELIKNFLDDQSLLKSKIVVLRDEIGKTQDQSKNLGDQKLIETLNELKKSVGLETAKGDGVEISLNDGVLVKRDEVDSIDQSLIHAADLRDLINVLRSARAEAISINDQRILSNTSITSVGNTILVNNFHLLPPFTVVAIGDTELMSQRLTDVNALPDLYKRQKSKNIQFSFAIKNGLLAPVYNGDFSVKYMKPVNNPT